MTASSRSKSTTGTSGQVKGRSRLKPHLEVLENRTLLTVLATATFEGHTYHVLSRQTWHSAETEANSLGGHLVTINSLAENNFVHDLALPFAGPPNPYNEQFAIGLTDEAVEGQFRWVDGSPVTFTNWASREPSNSNGVENWAYIYVDTNVSYDGKWNDNAEPIFPGVVDGAIVEVNTARPDLTAISLAWNTAQGGVDVNYTISGADLTKATTAALYWSADTTFDAAQDTLIPGSVTTTQTAIGTYPVHISAATLGTPPSGAKYLLAVVDPANTIDESDETNNAAALQLIDIVGTGVFEGYEPDPSDFNAPYIHGVTLYYSVLSGNDIPNDSYVRGALYWASGPNVADILDSEYPAYETGLDHSVGDHSQFVPVSSLSTPAFGASYLLFVADSLDFVVETDESNNVAAICMGPDFEMQGSYWSGLHELTVGVNASESHFPELFGFDTPSATVRVYWSSGTTLDSVIGPPIRENEVGYAGPGTYAFTVRGFGAPPTGATHILVAVDPDDLIAENNETNNVASLALPDLMGSVFSYLVLDDKTRNPDGSRVPNGPLPFNATFVIGATVKNDGVGDAGAFNVSFYASKDATIDTSDDFLGSTTVASLAAGASTTASLPGSVRLNQLRDWTGTIHLGFIIDADNTLAQIESNRANNANRAAVADRIDRAIVQLYDPLPPVFLMASGFRTEREASLYLFRNGFLSQLPGTGRGWTKLLSGNLNFVSRRDGIRRSGIAYRQDAGIYFNSATRTYYIEVQGSPTFGEPSPETAILHGPSWFAYVYDWHRRF